MVIYELRSILIEVLDAFLRLIPQLTKCNPPPTPDSLKSTVESPQTIIFLARYPDNEGEIIGTATLAIFQSPTGRHAWIEDVVVDQDARHWGIGKALTKACLQKALELGLLEVILTSKISRKAANRMYQSMDFVQRQTNVYRYPNP